MQADLGLHWAHIYEGTFLTLMKKIVISEMPKSQPSRGTERRRDEGQPMT